MTSLLPADTRRELAELASTYGYPLTHSLDLGPNSYLTSENLGVGAGEVW